MRKGLVDFFRLVRRAWMALVHLLGIVQNFILLALVYYVVVGPLSLIIRLSRQDPLAMRRMEQPSFYTPKERIPTDLERCERQF